AERLANVAVVAALHRVHGADQPAVGIDHGAATKRGGNRVHRAVQLPARDRIGTGGVDAAGGQVGQHGAIGTAERCYGPSFVVVNNRVGCHALDVADTAIQVDHRVLHGTHALVGFKQLAAGHRISAVFADI